MADLTNLNLSDIPSDTQTFEPLPPGEYVAVVDSEETTLNERGERTAIKLRISDGDHTGRVVFDSFMLKHDSEKAVGYAMRRAANYCKAIGKPDAKDTAEWVGHRVGITLGIDDYNGKRRNKVQAVFVPDEAVETAAKIPF